MYEEKTKRDELKLMVDFIPEEKLGKAIILIDNLLEFNNDLLKDIKDVEEGKNLYGPYENFDEMYNDIVNSDDDNDKKI